MFDADFSISDARYTDYDPAGNFIPGAIQQAASVGASLQDNAAWPGEIRLRYFGPRPLIEDNSVQSASTTMVNLQLGYKINRQLQATLDILNLLDSRTSDIDYYYSSQLAGEASSVNDIHTHPAEPRTLRFTMKLTF